MNIFIPIDLIILFAAIYTFSATIVVVTLFNEDSKNEIDKNFRGLTFYVSILSIFTPFLNTLICIYIIYTYIKQIINQQ